MEEDQRLRVRVEELVEFQSVIHKNTAMVGASYGEMGNATLVIKIVPT